MIRSRRQDEGATLEEPGEASLMLEIGTVETVVGLIALLVIAPILQFWTLKLGLNGMREDVKETRADVKVLVAADAEKDTHIAVHDQRLRGLESRMKQVETNG